MTRRVISGILHVLKSGCRWCDCPPNTAIDDDLQSLRALGGARRLERCSANSRARPIYPRTDDDATHVKAHRSASGQKGSTSRRSAVRAAGAIRKSTQSQMLKAAFFPSS